MKYAACLQLDSQESSQAREMIETSAPCLERQFVDEGHLSEEAMEIPEGLESLSVSLLFLLLSIIKAANSDLRLSAQSHNTNQPTGPRKT